MRRAAALFLGAGLAAGAALAGDDVPQWLSDAAAAIDVERLIERREGDAGLETARQYFGRVGSERAFLCARAPDPD